MKVCVVVLAVFVAAVSAGVISPIVPATTLVRTPSLDSAVIQSDRLGGNFAYSSVEGHAYAAVSPVVQNVVSPIGVSYHATPVATPINVLHHQYIHPIIAHPGAILAEAPIISPVAPGIVAPVVPLDPNQNLTPVAPAPVPVETAEAEPAKEEVAAAPAPAVVAEAPQSDDTVSVESV